MKLSLLAAYFSFQKEIPNKNSQIIKDLEMKYLSAPYKEFKDNRLFRNLGTYKTYEFYLFRSRN